MLITKFNKMIRNRIVWWFIGGIVIVTFVGWFSPRGGCETTQRAGDAGTLFGQPVTTTELRTAWFNTYLEVCMMTGRKPAVSPELDTALKEMAWKRLAALRLAKSLGIQSPSDAELLSEIQRQSIFQANGAFSRSQYKAFEQNVLLQLGTTAAQFEDKLREDMILSRLQAAVGTAAWMSPQEMQRLVARYGDAFKLEYVTLGTNLVAASEAAVTEADLQAFYAAHTNVFEVPDRVAVRYVAYEVSNYLSQASVTSDAVEEYYDTHTDQFTVPGTNDTKVLAPLDDVRGTISNLLVHETATQLARDKGTDLAVALTPARDGTATVFEKVAAELGLTVKTTALFDAQGPIPGIDAGREFAMAAFKLRATPDEYFSDAITGTNFVYVVALATNAEAYVPEFTQVRADVVPLARAKALQDALVRKGESVRRKFVEGLSQHETFAALAKQQAMNIHTTAYFSAFSAPEALTSSRLLEEIVILNRGDISPVLTSTNGLVIAYVADRKPATEEEANVVRSQLGANVMRSRARILFSEWQESLLRTGRKVATSATSEPITEE